MAFFDKLLGRTWQKFKARADKYRDEGERGLALQEYRSALSRIEGNDEEKAVIEDAIAEIRGHLRGEQLARATQMEEAGQFERARSALESAYSHSRTDHERAEIEDLRANLIAVEEGRAVDPVALAIAEGEAELLPEDRFNVLLGGLESSQSKHYRGLGEEFRDGWLALQEGDFDEAIPKLEAALEVSKDDPYVLTELGRAYLASDRNEDAIDALQKADEHGDSSVYIKLHRAQALWATEDFETAEKVLQSAHDVDEEDRRVFRAIGEHSLLSGDFEPGIEAVQLMLVDNSGDVSLLRMLGQLYHAKGDLDAAVERYESVLAIRWSLDPESKELIFDATSALAAASIYLEQEKRPERIIDLLHAMLSISSGAVAAQMYLGIARAHTMKKRKKDARKALSSALGLLPEDDEEGRSDVHRRLRELDS